MELAMSSQSSELNSLQAAIGRADLTSSAMQSAINDWFELYFERTTDAHEDPCQQLPYAIVNKISKAVFAEYNSKLLKQDTAKLKYLDAVRRGFDARRKELLQWVLVGGEAFAKPVPTGTGLHWQVIRRDCYTVLGRGPDGEVTELATSERCSERSQFYTLVELRRLEPDGCLTITNRLFCSSDQNLIGREVPLTDCTRYAALPKAYTYPATLGGLGLVHIKAPMVNSVDGGPDGVAIYASAAGLIHNINHNEFLLGREFDLGRLRVIASQDMLYMGQQGGKRKLRNL